MYISMYKVVFIISDRNDGGNECTRRVLLKNGMRFRKEIDFSLTGARSVRVDRSSLYVYHLRMPTHL